MPIYPNIKTYRGGFYTSKNRDRVYEAEDIRKPYDVIFSDGIKPDIDGTVGEHLRVSSNEGLNITIEPGFAKLGGAWFENESPYTITLDNPSYETRYDCVIIRNDDNDDVREPNIYIKSLNAVPTVNDLERNDKVYEVCIAYVTVGSNTTTINESNITDTRTEGQLCNIMTGVGATVVRAYRNTYYSESPNQSWLPIGIAQYRKDVDELIVSVEGQVFSEGTQYEIMSDVNVKMTIPLPVVGTKIDFVVHKNVNGAANGSTSQEVAQLITEVDNVKKTLSHDYYCNGVNDNVEISKLVKELLVGVGYGSVKLNVHGSFGAYAPVISGSTTDYWFDFNVTSDRKVIIDFSDSSQIITPITSGKTSVVFYGKNINLIGANLIVNNTATDTTIVVFDASVETIYCESCRFWVTGDKYCYIAKTGTFVNCRGSITNSRFYSYCFYTSGLVRVYGGEYYAYGTSGATSAIVGHAGSNPITILYGVNAPTIERAGYVQTNAIKQQGSGWVNCTDMITTLSLDVTSGISNVRGTIPLSKPGMM